MNTGWKSTGRKLSLNESRGMDEFIFTLGDVVLAEWEDKLYYAKIQKIDRVCGKCTLIFDDDSVEECSFAKIHSVTETTAEIVCIICKDGTSLRPNEIVLCDKCGIGYHQHCHDPSIPATALEFDAPWMCAYCSIGAFCPYLENPFENKPTGKGVRKTKIHTLKPGETCISSGNSTEEEKDLPSRNSLKTSEISTLNMSSYFFSHIHQNDGSKPRGKPAFGGHKSKSTGDKRGRGIAKPAGRTGSRDRDQFSDIGVNQQRKVSHHYQRHGSDDMSRHSGRYGSPVRRVGEDSEEKKSSPAEESRKFQLMEENKTSKVISHRRDAPREKQRLTQDLARQKRLLSEDIARAELLQREQLTKKITDMFDSKKEGLGTDKSEAEVNGAGNVSRDNINREREKESSPSMYEKCYGNYSPEYSNEHANNSSTHDESSDADCKGTALDRESLFDRFLRKESGAQEIKNIEFVNESKVEVKGINFKDTSVVNVCAESERCEANSVSDVRPELEPLKFENVTDDELAFSDGDRETVVTENNNISPNEYKLNGGSSTFLKTFSSGESGLGSASNVKCNVMEATRELRDLSPKNDLDSEENVISNLKCESCECPSEDVDVKSEEKTCKGSEMCSKRSLEPDHSNIKSSKIARLMEEPDMQCEHSSKHSHDCASQNDQVCTHENGDFEEGDNVTSTNQSEKQSLQMENQIQETSVMGGVLERNAGKRRPEMKETRSSEQAQNNSCDAEQNPETVVNESELSNNEGMSDAGELSETEACVFVNRGKVKKKKRRKTKGHKGVHQSGFGSLRRKTKSHKGRSVVKDAKTTKRIKHFDSESDCEALRGKSQERNEDIELTSSSHSTGGQQRESGVTETNDHCEKDGETRSLSPSEDCFPEECLEEVVTIGTVVSDHCESSQETSVFSDSQQNTLEEDAKKELGKTERKIGKTKRKNEEKERERSTPPHLISQNRYARDLPRHNWLVERLRQQNKLCTEDGQQQARDSKDEESNEENPGDDEHEGFCSSDKDTSMENRNSPKISSEKCEIIGDPSPKLPCGDQNPASTETGDFENELHRSFFRCFPPNVPRTLPRLKSSMIDSSSGNDNKPQPPPLKHGLSSKESSGMEPVPKLRKIVDEKEALHETTKEKGEINVENTETTEPRPSGVEQPRKVMSPIEILDDDDEKKKHGQDGSETNEEKLQEKDQNSVSKLNDTSQKDGEKSPMKSLPRSSPDKPTLFTSPKKPFGTVNPTIPGNVKDKFGRPMDMPPHRAAILIPVVPMHDGSGMPISPALSSASPHMKGFSPRTFTPHLLTHGARPVPVSGMFGSPLSPGGRYSATNCGHHIHGNMKAGIPCKRDLNCPFHGNGPRGVPPGILDIPGHHGSIHTFGGHGHDHMSAVMSRERRERDKNSCRSPLGREALGDKQVPQTPKVVKPIAHVPGKRPPLMLSHLQQIGKQPASLRELEALYEEKSQRYGSELLLSPHQPRKSPERSPREQVVPSRSLQQPLTLSDLNRRREEELLKGKVDEGLKTKSVEFLPSGLAPTPRGPSKLTTPPHSKDLSLLSPGRGHRSASISPVDKRDQFFSLRRLVEEREPGAAIMNEFLKPGPPLLRPLDEADVRQSSERQRGEEVLLTRRHVSPFSRVPSTKEAVIHPVKISEGVEIVSPRGLERLGQAGLVERDEEKGGPKSCLGNSSTTNPGVRLLEDKRKQIEEARSSSGRDEQRSRERVSPDMDHRLRLEQAAEPKARSRSLELVQLKEKESKKGLGDKDTVLISGSERERSDDIVLLMSADGNKRSRIPTELSPPLRHKLYQDRAFVPPGVAGRIDPRMDPRMFAFHELEIHRRGEAIRASEPSHRELLSRMASSLPISKGGSPIGKPLFVRPDGFFDRRAPEAGRLSSDVHRYSPPTSLSSREYGPMMNSRQAMERLAAAAGKPGSLLGEVGKDIPPHIRQDIERERERERQRLSLEQIEANRRLLHAELKDKVNPLVFSKEHQFRMEQRREHMDAMRAREKRISDRERQLFMEQRIAEEKKRRYSELESRVMRHPSHPQFGHVTDRDEYERAKRLKLAEPPISSPVSIQHSKHLSPGALHSERKEPLLSSPKNNLTHSQFRDKTSEATDSRISHPRENELIRKATNSGKLERDSIWHRSRELAALAQGGMEHKRSNMHPSASFHGFMPPKVGPLISQREEVKGAGAKVEEDGVNRCSVCKRDASFLCSGCQAAWYCSTECQLSAWGTHSRECSQNKRQQQPVSNPLYLANTH